MYRTHDTKGKNITHLFPEMNSDAVSNTAVASLMLLKHIKTTMIDRTPVHTKKMPIQKRV